MKQEKNNEEKNSRRQFIQWGLLSVLAVPLFKSKDAFAAACGAPTGDAAKKAIDDATAKRIKYVADATAAASQPKYKAGSNCGNCKFYTAAKAVGDHAPCTMAGTKFVANCGWCSLYNKKA